MRLVWRCKVASTYPVWSANPVPAYDNRWVSESSEIAVFTADSEIATYAEFVKHAERDNIAWRAAAVVVGHGEADIGNFVDLCEPPVLASRCCTLESLTVDIADDLEADIAFRDPRRIWDEIVAEGKDGVIAPSAAFMGAKVVVIRVSALRRILRVIEIRPGAIPAGFEDHELRVRGVPILPPIVLEGDDP